MRAGERVRKNQAATRALWALVATMMAVAFAAVIAAAPMGAQSAWAADNALAAGGISADQGAVDTASGYEKVYGYNITANNRTSGSVKYDSATKTLTLNNFKGENTSSVTSDIYIDSSFSGQTIKVKLVGSNTMTRISSYASLVFQGKGTLNAKVSTYKGAKTTIKGATINGSINSDGKFTMNGGKVTGSVISSGAVATITKGTIIGSIDTAGKLFMKGGFIRYSKSSDYTTAVSCKGLDMRGGTIRAQGAKTGIRVSGKNNKLGNLVVKGGKIIVAGASNSAITVMGGNLIFKKGVITVKRSKADAIDVYYNTFKGKKYGGNVQIKCGKLTAGVTNPKSYYAIMAQQKISNCLLKAGAIIGKLSKGATFKDFGNLYQVNDYNSVTLKKYGKTGITNASIGEAYYGRCTYNITAIGAGAFNTSAGHKVVNLEVRSYSYLDSIGANAFYGTTALRTLTFYSYGWMKANYSSSYKLTSVTTRSGCVVAKNAFAKMGYKSGAGLTVKIGKYGTYRKEAGYYKNYLVAHGMPRAAKLYTY